MIEIRRTAQRREHGIILQAAVSAKMADDDGTLEKFEGKFAVTAEQEVGRDLVSDFRVGIGQPKGCQFLGELGRIGG